VQIIDGAGRWTPPGDAANDWVEHLSSAGSLGLDLLHPAGGVDTRSAHTEDEIYVVTAGRATIVTPDGQADVGPRAVISVPAGEEYRFVDITKNLSLLVVFGPAYGHGRRAGSARCSTSRSCADDAPRYAHTRPYRGDAVIAGAADDRQDSPDLRRHHGHRP